MVYSSGNILGLALLATSFVCDVVSLKMESLKMTNVLEQRVLLHPSISRKLDSSLEKGICRSADYPTNLELRKHHELC